MATPRKSQLANRNPLETPHPASAKETPAVEVSEAQADPAPPQKPAAGSQGKKKVSFYQRKEEIPRTRAAWMHTMGHTGLTNYSHFVDAALEQFTRQLEAEYNDSKPFPEVEE